MSRESLNSVARDAGALRDADFDDLPLAASAGIATERAKKNTRNFFIGLLIGHATHGIAVLSRERLLQHEKLLYLTDFAFHPFPTDVGSVALLDGG